MKKTFWSVAFILCCSVASFVHAADADAFASEQLRTSVSSRLQISLDELARHGVLGAVLGLDVPGLPRIVLTTGTADRNGDQPMTEDHAFQIGSQSKVFTAVAILMLERQGRLDLDDHVEKYVPHMPGGQDATIRQLLTHTSGLGDGVSILDESADLPRISLSFRDLTLLSHIDGQHFFPGEKFEYNNFGFDILGVIIEHVSGSDYEKYIKRNILEPLGLKHTFSGSKLPWPSAKLANGYVFEKGTRQSVDATGPRDLSWASSAGDMISTAGDMMAWMKALENPANPVGISLKDLTSTVVDVEGSPEMFEYGYGLMHRRFSGVETWGHGGFIHGYISYTGHDPLTDIRFSLLTSMTGNEGDQTTRIMTEIGNVIRVTLHLGGLASSLSAMSEAKTVTQ